VGGSIRDGVDTPARYGGEEFAVIMPDTDLSGALHVAERLRESVENSEFIYEQQSFKVTISVGCAEFPLQAENRDDLIEKADIALYASKHKGRNCATAYSPELEDDVPVVAIAPVAPVSPDQAEPEKN
jgi:diguanylate cyclase (GGDEF)-like protein